MFRIAGTNKEANLIYLDKTFQTNLTQLIVFFHFEISSILCKHHSPSISATTDFPYEWKMFWLLVLLQYKTANKHVF